MKLLRVVLLLACALLAACESTPTRTFTYGARGAEIEAERLVAMVYGKPADPLPYGGPDIDRSFAAMQARWPELKPLLAEGALGVAEDGEIAVRDVGSRDLAAARELRRLVKAENRDRDLLYRGVTAAIGHRRDTLPQMLGFVEETFAREWRRQAPAGWWFRDARGAWRQRGDDPAESGKTQ